MQRDGRRAPNAWRGPVTGGSLAPVGFSSALDAENRVESDHLEDLPCLGLGPAEGQTPGIEVAIPVDVQQRVEALRVEEAHPGEVDHHLPRPYRERLDQR